MPKIQECYMVAYSIWRDQSRKFRSFDSDPPTFIQPSEMYGILAKAQEGYFVVKGL